jgi:GNAT superfamily N-acetyltransferase
MFKAVDTEADNRIVGATIWQIYTKERSLDEIKDDAVPLMRIPEINQEVREAFMAGINQARFENMGTAPVVMLGTLVVDPDYQRRGIGSKLMEWGVQEADR